MAELGRGGRGNLAGLTSEQASNMSADELAAYQMRSEKPKGTPVPEEKKGY